MSRNGVRQVNYEVDKEVTAKRMRESLERSGITASNLASKSGVSKSQISQYVHARMAPSNIAASKMAPYLNVNPVWLMGFDAPEAYNPDNPNGADSTSLGTTIESPAFTPKEIEILHAYRISEQGIKAAIQKLLDIKSENNTQDKMLA